MNSKTKNLTTEYTELHRGRKSSRTMNSVKLRVLCGFYLLFISCTSQKLPVQEIFFERDGKVITSVKAEIARTDEERSNGLMYRKKLKDGEGMLFVYDRDEILSFWMKNTLIPLSIAFINSDGRIIEVRDMYPGDLKSVVSSRSVRFALEAPQGWFARSGVETGDVARIDHIR